MKRPLFPEVTVNGTAIPPAAIAAEAQNHAAPSGKPGWAWHAAARALAVRELLRQEAARRGLASQPRDLSCERRETAEEAAIRQLLESEIDVPAPTEMEVRAAYEAAPDRFCAANAEVLIPFEAVRHRIASAIERARWTAAARAFTAGLVESAAIEGVSFDSARQAARRSPV